MAHSYSSLYYKLVCVEKFIYLEIYEFAKNLIFFHICVKIEDNVKFFNNRFTYFLFLLTKKLILKGHYINHGLH